MKVNEFNPENFKHSKKGQYAYHNYVIAAFENFKFYIPYSPACILVRDIVFDGIYYPPYIGSLLEGIVRLCKCLENIKIGGKDNKYYNLLEIFHRTINKNNEYRIDLYIYSKYEIVYLDILKKSDVYKTVFATFRIRLKGENVKPEEIKASKLLELIN